MGQVYFQKIINFPSNPLTFHIGFVRALEPCVSLLFLVCINVGILLYWDLIEICIVTVKIFYNINQS